MLIMFLVYVEKLSYITGLVAVKNVFTNIPFLVCFCPLILKLLSWFIVHTYLMVGYCLSVVHTKKDKTKT